jgi:hypothetical protein
VKPVELGVWRYREVPCSECPVHERLVADRAKRDRAVHIGAVLVYSRDFVPSANCDQVTVDEIDLGPDSTYRLHPHRPIPIRPLSAKRPFRSLSSLSPARPCSRIDC